MSSQQNAFGRGYSANSRNLTTLEDEYTLTVTPEIPLAYYQARDHQSGDQPGLETFWPGDENAPWPSYSQWNEETAYLDDYSDLDPNYTPLGGSSVPFDAHGIRPGHRIEATGIGRDSLRANQSHMGSVLPRSGASGSTVRPGSGMDWYMGHLEGSQQFESNIPYPNSDTETISVPLHQSHETADVERALAIDKEKPWKCERCPARFARKRDCTRHVRSVHTQDSPYTCHGCGDAFVRSDARGRHWKMDPTCVERHKQATGSAEPSSKPSSPVA